MPLVLVGVLIGSLIAPNVANAPSSGDATVPDRSFSAPVARAAIGGTLAAGLTVAPLAINNRFLRVGEGKFPEPFSKRISIGSQKGKKIEAGISKQGRIDVKVGPFRKTIRKGNRNSCGPN